MIRDTDIIPIATAADKTLLDSGPDDKAFIATIRPVIATPAVVNPLASSSGSIREKTATAPATISNATAIAISEAAAAAIPLPPNLDINTIPPYKDAMIAANAPAA